MNENDAPLSPATMLAAIINNIIKLQGIWLITGKRQVGKTTWCASVAHHARINGWNVCGLISPAIFSDGEKVGFDMVDLKSGNSRRLGVLGNTHPDWIQCGQWSIDPSVIAWANDQLKQCPGCDLLILDEIGPMELEQNQGLQEGLRLIDENLVTAAFVVIRPELLAIAKKRWLQARVLEIKKT